MITINSQKLKDELDDILHYEFKRNDLGKDFIYDFAKELYYFLDFFLDFSNGDDYLLTRPKIYTADGERFLYFICTNLEDNKTYLFKIKYYIGIEEVTIKDSLKEEIKKYKVDDNLNYNLNYIVVHPDNLPKRKLELVDEKGKYTLNYQSENNILKIDIISKNINKNLNLLMDDILYIDNMDLEHILNYLKKEFNFLKTEIKIVISSYDENRDYTFNYLLIKDGKVIRYENKNNDVVVILDEKGEWHYYDKDIKLEEDSNLNETVTFKCSNKKVLTKKMTLGEKKIKKCQHDLAKIGE